MTTSRQIKRMLQPLIERSDDLAFIDRWLIVTPVTHIARGVILDATSNKKTFSAQWAVTHLFELQTHFSLDWGGYVYNRGEITPNYWDRTEREIGDDVIFHIEKNVLPILRTMTTLDVFVDFVAQQHLASHLFDWPDVRMIVETARGDLETAQAIWKANRNRWKRREGYDEHDRLKAIRVCELGALLEKDDRSSLSELLHQWELQTVRNLKLEKVWKKTPFPLDEM